MAITKRTVLQQVTVNADGAVSVKLACQVLEDGVVLLSHPHRTTVGPNADIDTQIGLVNANLAQGVELTSGSVLTFPGVETAALARLRRIVNADRGQSAQRKES